MALEGFRFCHFARVAEMLGRRWFRSAHIHVVKLPIQSSPRLFIEYDFTTNKTFNLFLVETRPRKVAAIFKQIY